MNSKPVFKDSFKEYFKHLLGSELDAFIKACKKPLRDSIRVNTNKCSAEDVKQYLTDKGWEFESVPFYDDGLIINERGKALGNTIEHFMGYYYVQEQSSMIPPLVLNPEPGDKVLDCCASPGSKTSQISQLMNNKGVIVANDKDLNRVIILRNNLQRCGCRNVITTRGKGEWFGEKGMVFDKVLVDAPCTGFGAIRKDWSIAEMFNPSTFGRLKRVQSGLLNSGFKSLKRGGELVYSTCTLTLEENEEVIKNFLDYREDAELLNIKLSGFENSRGVNLKEAIRIWPHKKDMEGFFIARLKKV